ncbi:MAG: DUF3084 domain-containing protein [Fimbriimonadaceae bacterium]|nr:DUF3084 domain-containing protein [Fimbriimonadaceae bacterium]
MDLVGIGFVLLFGVVGAAVAYGADSLGRTLGKKRLTLFKLRPRHTAAVITSVAGFAIPILTVLLVALLSSDVRVWLIEGRRAIRENQNLIQRLDDESRRFKSELADLERQKNELARQTLDLRTSYSSLQTKVSEQNDEIGSNRKLLSEEKAKLAAAQAQRQAAQGKLAALESKYKNLDKSYAKLETDYQKQVKNLNDNVFAINADLSDKEHRLKETRSELETAVTQFDLQRKTFEADIAKAREDLEKFRTARDEAQGALDGVRKEKERVEWELGNLRKLQLAAEQGLNQNLKISRTQPLIFRGGEEVARIQIDPNLSPEAARAMMTSLLRSARMAAEKRGSVANADGEAAGLVDLPMDNRTVTAQDQFDGLAKAVTQRSDSSVLIAYAFWNGFQGEFLPLRIEAYQNPIIYSKGQRISETRVDGTLTEESILNAINDFLAKSVGQDAIKSGMIPAVGADRPLGEVTPDEVLALVKEIKGARRTIRLLAFAAQETRAADPLKVEFKLR